MCQASRRPCQCLNAVLDWGQVYNDDFSTIDIDGRIFEKGNIHRRDAKCAEL